MKFEFHQGLFNYPYNDFKKHLEIFGNSRILFSGKFGIGKSVFLSKFFDEDVRKQKGEKVQYEAFHIYPVNYSIASNEDVFSYIKYDIVTTLLSKGIQPEEVDLRFLDTLPEYLKGNLSRVISTILFMIPKVGKDISEQYDKLEELIKNFLKYDQNCKETDGDKLISFLVNSENKAGSIFENDIITKLICKVITRHKKETGKENVLVIDDMDRIDPEHVFRLLNVFAAHLDNPNNVSNKLGFDKVIIVCDIKNLRNIFKARYGADTDFNGYIDKFYSYDVYHFDNRKILHEISYESFKNVMVAGTDNYNSEYHLSRFFDRYSFGLELCEMLIYNRFISLRNLIARIGNTIEIDINKTLVFDDMSTMNQVDVPILVHFTILKEFVGGYDILKDCFQKIPHRAFTVRRINQAANALMFFVYYEQTLRMQDPVTIHFNNKELVLKKTGQIRDGLNLLVYDPRNNVNITDPTQYKFSIQEFRILLLDFIDLLKRIDN